MLTISPQFRKKVYEYLHGVNPDFANSQSEHNSYGEEKTGFKKNNQKNVSDGYKRKPFDKRWASNIGGIVGLQEIIYYFITILKRGIFPTPIIFSGPRGTGKTTLAKIFARKIACMYFNLKTCLYESCMRCEHSGGHYYTLDCASTDNQIVEKFIKKYLPFAPWLNCERNVFFLDEMNDKKAISISKFLIRIVEDYSEAVFFIGVNESLDEIDIGLRARAKTLLFEPPSLDEICAWLYKYANSEGINLTLFNSFLLAKFTSPECIPRACLQSLQNLYYCSVSESHLDAIISMFKLSIDQIEQTKNEFSQAKDSIEKISERWITDDCQ